MIDTRPYSMQFVMRKTFRHMHQQIDLSSGISSERLAGISDSKRGEVLETLGQLAVTKKMLTDFQNYNKHLFED